MSQLDPGWARIRIKGLLLRIHIGIKEEGANNKQVVFVNLNIFYAAVNAVQSEDRLSPPNYRTLTSAIIQKVEGCHFTLLEHLPDVIFDLVMEHPAVCCTEVEVKNFYDSQPFKSVSIGFTKFRSPSPERTSLRFGVGLK